MIRFLRHSEIDQAKWDNLIEEYEGEKIYGQSWFLDSVAPEWCALVYGDYQAAIPLITSMKWRQPYIFHPPYLQRFSIYQKPHLEQDLSEKILNAIPSKFRLIRLNLFSNPNCFPRKFILRRCRNQYLDTSICYSKIKKNYKKGLKYSIRKARRNGIYIRSDLSRQELLQFYQRRGAYRPRIQPKHLTILLELLKNARQQNDAKLWGAFNSEGYQMSIGFSVMDSQKIYYLHQSNDNLGKKFCSSHFMTDRMIEYACQKAKKLDFVGSNIPGIAFFNDQFGCENEYYYSLLSGSKNWIRCLIKTIAESKEKLNKLIRS